MPLPPSRPGAPAVLRGFVSVHGRRLETATIVPDDTRAHATPIVLLHDAFGSWSAWERFPREIASATRCPVLAYSRAGHGRSDPPAAPASADYLQAEAVAVLPAVLDLRGIERPLLVGHGDGAAIALIHAGSGFDVAGVVALAPRSAIEEPAIGAVRDAHARLLAGDPMPGFARHHRDPLALLARWASTWSSPAFRAWSLLPYCATVTAPVVLVQGEDDEHASLTNLASLARALRGPVQTLELEAVGDAPWEDAPRTVAAAVAALADRDRAQRQPRGARALSASARS